MNVYVGSTFSRYPEARAVIDALTLRGHTITHDWTRTEAFGADGHPVPNSAGGYDLPPDVQADHARDDLNAVRRADLLLMLGQEASCGWLVEVGAALAWGTAQVWIVAPFRPTVFWQLPQVQVFADVAEALELLGPLVVPATTRSSGGVDA